ncbi:MAG: hypothetical protein M3545_03730 [Acidobacteriota bacterium]|nr:hypothetical protein [Acidobacteriota bacterium]
MRHRVHPRHKSGGPTGTINFRVLEGVLLRANPGMSGSRALEARRGPALAVP